MSKMMIGDKEKEFEICPAGNHVARVFFAVDMGTQTYTFQGHDISQRKVRIAFELPNEKYTYTDREGNEVEKCHIVGNTYTASKGSRSKLRPVLNALLGDIPAEDMDIFEILGKTCMVDVVHAQSKSTGRTYAKINAVTSLPKGLEVPEQQNDSVKFTWDDFVKEEYEKLPDWVKRAQQETPEFVAKFGKFEYPEGDINPDDIPF